MSKSQKKFSSFAFFVSLSFILQVIYQTNATNIFLILKSQGLFQSLIVFSHSLSLGTINNGFLLISNFCGTMPIWFSILPLGLLLLTVFYGSFLSAWF